MKFKLIKKVENGGAESTLEMENGMKKSFNFAELVYKNHLIGTAEYASPEMLNNNITSYLTTDLWALGCIIYKFFHGRTPFKGNNEMIIFDNILNMKYAISKDLPQCVQDIIRKLLVEHPEDRLGSGEMGGCNDIESLKQHEFFKGIDFGLLYNQTPPLKINFYNSRDKFKSSDNIRSFLSPPSNNASEISDFNIPNFLHQFSSGSIANSPKIKLKTSSSFNVLNQVSLCDYTFESFFDLQEEDIIEDYMFKVEKFNSKEKERRGREELIQEGVLKKKAWIIYYHRKLKLYNNGKLEVWDVSKNKNLIVK